MNVFSKHATEATNSELSHKSRAYSCSVRATVCVYVYVSDVQNGRCASKPCHAHKDAVKKCHGKLNLTCSRRSEQILARAITPSEHVQNTMPHYNSNVLQMVFYCGQRKESLRHRVYSLVLKHTKHTPHNV